MQYYIYAAFGKFNYECFAKIVNIYHKLLFDLNLTETHSFLYTHIIFCSF